ncbi:hypothetical protein ACHAWF_014209 [Thalassiosira exigua]
MPTRPRNTDAMTSSSRMAPLLASALLLLSCACAAAAGAETEVWAGAEAERLSGRMPVDEDRVVGGGGGHLRATTSQHAAPAEKRRGIARPEPLLPEKPPPGTYHYPDVRLGGCRSGSDPRLASWTTAHDDNGYLFRDSKSCCEVRFPDDAEECLEISIDAASDDARGTDVSRREEGEEESRDYYVGASGFVFQERRLDKAGKVGAKGVKHYYQSGPSWPQQWQSAPRPSWQKPSPPRPSPPRWNGWNANNWNWHPAPKAEKSSKSKSNKSAKVAQYYPLPQHLRPARTPEPTPRPTPRPSRRPVPSPSAPAPVDPAPSMPDGVRGVEIDMGGILVASNLSVPPAGSEELTTLARAFEKTLLTVLDDGFFECDVYRVGGVSVGSHEHPRRKDGNRLGLFDRDLREGFEGGTASESAVRPAANRRAAPGEVGVERVEDAAASHVPVRNAYGTDRMNRSLEPGGRLLQSTSDVLFTLKTVRPCPGCTATQAVVLGARVFDETFDELDAKAKSGELTVIFCIFAEVAKVVTDPCTAKIRSAEGTSLDVSFAGTDGGGTEPTPPTPTPPAMPTPPTPAPPTPTPPTIIMPPPTPGWLPTPQPVETSKEPTESPVAAPSTPAEVTTAPPTSPPSMPPVDSATSTPAPTTPRPTSTSTASPAGGAMSAEPTASPASATPAPVTPAPVTPSPTEVTSAPSDAPSPAPTDDATGAPTNDATDGPTDAPSAAAGPTRPPNTVAPTSVPPGATYYDGFERGTFPDGDPNWSTSGDAPWELASDEANSGAYAIRSPDFAAAGEVSATKRSNATLTTSPSWPAGTLVYSVLGSVEMPYDAFEVYVDGAVRDTVSGGTEFERRAIELDPGLHEVTFAYRYNPEDLDGFPPRPADHRGAAYLDDVYFLPEGTAVDPPPSLPPASTPSPAGPATAACDVCPGGITATAVAETCRTVLESAMTIADPASDACAEQIDMYRPICCPDELAGGCDVCPGGIASQPTPDDAETCQGAVESAMIAMEPTSEGCAELTELYRPICCPDDLSDACVMCPNGVTVGTEGSAPNPAFDAFDDAAKIIIIADCQMTIPSAATFGPAGSDSCAEKVFVMEAACCPTSAVDPCSPDRICSEGGTKFDEDAYFLEEWGLTCGFVASVAEEGSRQCEVAGKVLGEEGGCCVPEDGTSTTPAPAPTTIAPTSIPSGAVYYTGFEQGDFPDGTYWSTSGDGVWELTNERANSGVYSIKSPDLAGLADMESRVSNVTLSTDPTWGGGTLVFSVLAGTSLPRDDLVYAVDGEYAGDLSEMTDFQVREVELGPGPHEVTFSYRFNPLDASIFPPENPDRAYAAFLDDVFFVPGGGDGAPTPAPAPSGGTAPTPVPILATVGPTSTVSVSVAPVSVIAVV